MFYGAENTIQLQDMLPEVESNYQYHQDTNTVTYHNDLPARYISTIVPQMLLGVTNHFLIGFKVHSMKQNPCFILINWGEKV